MRYKIEIKNLKTNTFYRSNPELFLRLLNLINSKPNWKKLLLTSEYTEVNIWIFKILPQLRSSFFTYETRVFWILNDIHDFPKCKNPNCGFTFNDRNVYTVRKGYSEYCTHKCAVNSDEVKQKSIETCLKKYGTVSPGQAESVKTKSRQTCLKKYGVEYSFQSEDVKEKSRNTCLEKYGVNVSSKSKDIQNKIRTTKQEKFGNNQPWHSEEALEKRKETWLKKYGMDHPVRSQEIKNKIQSTIFSKYGVSHWSQTNEFKLDRLKISYEKNIINCEFDEPCFSLEDYQMRNSDSDVFVFKCKKCGNKFESRHHDGVHGHCPKCYPHEQSNAEKYIADTICTYGFNIERNNRKLIKPFELDIYVPEKRLAIEFDGIYWHSAEILAEKHNSINAKTYHLIKTAACEEQRIQLIHIFENEWQQKQDIVMSRIKSLLGIYDRILYARNCEVKEIDQATSIGFQTANHIQGAVNSTVSLGLFNNGELISLMTFGKCRFDKKHEWEMLRFCSKIGYHIPGAAGKLLKYFERHFRPMSLVSYADRRWSTGKLYKTLGFDFVRNSPPNYWYFKPGVGILLSRLNFQKHKLKNKLEKFDPNKTEVENMKENGYFRIFDCGNMVFEKTYPAIPNRVN